MSNLKITDHVPDLIKAIKVLTGREVLVGVPESNADRDGGPINNAALAYIHDKGAPEANIPSRPFLEKGVEKAQSPIAAQLKKGAIAALDGNHANVDKALHSAGLVAQNSVKSEINDGDFEPLKPATIKARKRKGFAGTKPLIRTGQLRNSIQYLITNKPQK